jgi:hypothetical protein
MDEMMEMLQQQMQQYQWKHFKEDPKTKEL